MSIAVSTLPQNILQFFRLPATLSVTASLGMHGLMWMTSPFIPLEDSTAATGPLTVNVVKLTPEELSRLPQDATALFDPSQSPLASNGSTTTLGPDSSLPPIPALPALPPPPADVFSTLPSLNTLSSLPSIPPASDPALVPPIGALPPPPISSSLETFDPRQLPPISPNLPPTPVALGTIPPFPPGTIPSLPPNNPQNPDPNLTDPTPAPSPATPETRRPIPQAALDRLRDLQRLRAANPGTSLDPTLPQQAQDWLARAGSSAPRKLIFDNVPYPKSACPAKGYVTVTASVNGQGQVTRAEVTKSSNIPDLDEIALKAAKAHTYEPSADGKSQTYWIPFDFDPVAGCQANPSASPASSPIKPGTSSNPTPSKPTASPNSPSATPSAASTTDPARSQPVENSTPTSEPATPTPG